MNVEPIEAYLADLVGGEARLELEPAHAEAGAHVAGCSARRTLDAPVAATQSQPVNHDRNRGDGRDRDRDGENEIPAAAPEPLRTGFPESPQPDAQPATNSAPGNASHRTAQAEPIESRPIIEYPTQPTPPPIPSRPAPTALAASPRLLPARERDEARTAGESVRVHGGFCARERSIGPTTHTVAWLAFKLNDQTFAIEVVKSQEVLLVPPVVPVRGTDPALLGLTNLRGLLVPVMDLSIRLKLPPARYDERSRIIVLETAGQCLGLKVTSVGDVTPVALDAIEGLESSLFSNGNRYARGVYRLAGRTMILLSAEELLKG